MMIQQMKSRLFISVSLSFIGVLLLYTTSFAGDFNTIVSAQNDYYPSNFKFFEDDSGDLNLFFEHQGHYTVSKFFYSRLSTSGEWSTPIEFQIPFSNSRTFQSVNRLSNRSALLLFSGDNTDYARLFDLSDSDLESFSFDKNIQSQLGIASDELSRLLAKNRRLFFSVLKNGRWSIPLPVPDTYLAGDPELSVGDTKSLLVFSKDMDGNEQTLADRELFISLFNGILWTVPQRLTTNHFIEYDVQTVYQQGRFTVTWLIDGDNAMSTANDKEIHVAHIESQSGDVAKGRVFSEQAFGNLNYRLAELSDRAVLFWKTSLGTDSTLDSVVWWSEYSGSWSNPRQTGIHAAHFVNPEVLTHSEFPILVYREGSIIKGSLFNDGRWQPSASLLDLNRYGWTSSRSDYRLFGTNDLYFASSTVPSAGDFETADSFSELKVLRIPLRQDVAIQMVNTLPHRLDVGVEVNMSIIVGNRGFTRSDPFSLTLSEGGEEIRTFSTLPLLPGENRRFNYEFKLDKPFKNITLSVDMVRPDANPDNDKYLVELKTFPDFIVRSVKQNENGNFVADIIETKGIAAPPVDVVFSLQTSGGMIRIGEGEFDPSVAAPLTIVSPSLPQSGEYYQIIAEINPDRAIKEDYYLNNKKAFIFKPLADYKISLLRVSPHDIYLTGENIGNRQLRQMDLLLTDDPSVIGSKDSVSSAIFYDTLDTSPDGSISIRISRDTIGNIMGKTLYGIVNPYHRFKESDHNNNIRSVFVSRAIIYDDTGGGNGGGIDDGGEGGGGGKDSTDDVTFDKASLTMDVARTWCDTIQIEVGNIGSAVALSSELRLLNAANMPVLRKLLPVLPSDTYETVILKRLQPSDYRLKLNYSPMFGESEVIELDVSLPTYSESECSETQGKDIAFHALSLEETFLQRLARRLFNRKGSFWQRIYRGVKKVMRMEETALVKLELSATRFHSSYRRPLVRVPLSIQIKAGPQVKFKEKQTLYIIETDDSDILSEKLKVPNQALTKGSKIIIETPVRNDEIKGSNNIVELWVDE